MRKRVFVMLLAFLAIGLNTQGCAMRQSLNQSKSLDVAKLRLEEDSIYKNTTLIRLSNGMTVLIKKDDRFPTVSTRLYVRAGSALENADRAGISHLLEHMVFKGTKKYPKASISRTLENAGAYLNASTSFDYTVYINDLPSDQWQKGIETVAEMALHATLNPSDLTSEKEVVIAELKRGKDNPKTLVFQELQRLVFKGIPYERPIIGYEPNIRQTTSQDMKDYVKRFYQPQNMLLTVVGNIDPEKIISEAERQFGNVKNTHALPAVLPYDLDSLQNGDISVINGDLNKAYVALAIPVPCIRDFRSINLDILASLLGGNKTSLWVRKYEYDEKLVDDISVSNISFAQIGLFMVSAEMDPKNVETFCRKIIADLRDLSIDSFTDEELSREKFSWEHSKVLTRETIAGMSSELGYSQFFLGGEQGDANVLHTIRQIDRNDLTESIEKWIQPNRLSIVCLVPKNTSLTSDAILAVKNENWSSDKPSKTIASTDSLKPEIIELGSGRRVVLCNDNTLPHFAARLIFHGGDALNPKDKQGLADLTARSLLVGTGKLSRDALNARIESMSASISASSRRTSFETSISGPTIFESDLLDLWLTVMREPSFDKKELATEIQRQIADIKSAEDRPVSLLLRHLPSFLFPDSVYGYMINGIPNIVAGYTPSDCAEFWRRQFNQGWVLSVAGKFNRDDILKFANNLPKPQASFDQVPIPNWTDKKYMPLSMKNRKQAHLMLIYPAVPEDHEDSAGLHLLSNALNGMAGPLFVELRDKRGLGYTVNSFYASNDKLGYMGFYIGTDPSRLDEAETALTKIIYDLSKTTLPKSEVSRGLHQWEGSEIRSGQSLSKRASRYGELTLRNKPLTYHRDLINKAKGLTPNDLKELAVKYLRQDKMIKAVVLP